MTLTVRRQLLALVTLAVLGFAVLGSVSLVQMGRVFSGASFAADNTVPSLLVLDDAMDTLATQRLRFW